MAFLDCKEPPKGSAPKGALDGWSWDPVKDDYVLKSTLTGEAKEVEDAAGGKVERAISEDEFSRLYSSDNFRSNVAGVLSLGGAVARLKSLDVDKDDPSFAKAMDVAYTRLINGPNAFVLQFMSNKDLVDFLIVSAWAGPFAKAVATEITAKKKAKAMAQPASPPKAEGPKAKSKQKPEPRPATDKVGGGSILGTGD